MHLTHGLRRAARQTPAATAYSFLGKEVTWRAFEDRVARAAAGLSALGVRSGDRIVIMSENTPAFVEAYQAAAWCGAVLACMNTRWSAKELAAAVADAGADVVLMDRKFASLGATLKAERPAIRHLVYADVDTPPAGWASWDGLVADHAPAADLEPDPHAVRFLFYTSGTTGQPKGVMLSGHNLAAAAMMAASEFGFCRDGNFAACMPLFHIGGAVTMLAQVLAGGRLTLLRKFDAALLTEATAAERVTQVLLVPTMINALLARVEADPGRFAPLKRIIYGAAPMPEALLRRALALLPGAGFQQAYAMTETSGVATSLPPADHDPDGPNAHRLGSVGRAVTGVDLKIVDAAGRDAPTGEPGEIWMRSDGVTQGYWQRPQESAEALANGGWLRSGDGGRMDADGYIYITDRLKDMIITGGENVYSIEVENALSSHPAISECAVVGLPDPHWGETVTAIVTLRDGCAADEAALVAHCRTLLGGYKVPRKVVIAADLPKSAAGKILKRTLREQLAAAATGNSDR